MNYSRFTYGFFFLLLLYTNAFAQTIDATDLSGTKEINDYIKVHLLDHSIISDSVSIDINEIKPSRFLDRFSKNHYLLEFKITSKSDKELIFTSNNLSLVIDQFIVNRDSTDRRILKNKYDFRRNNTRYDLSLLAGEEYTIQIVSWSNSYPLANSIALFEEKAFFKENYIIFFSKGLFFIYLFLVSGVAFSTWIIWRAKYILWLALHLCSLAYFLFSLSGMTHFLLGIPLETVKLFEQSLALGLSGIFYVCFVFQNFDMYKEKNWSRYIKNICRVLTGLLIVSSFISLAYPYWININGFLLCFTIWLFSLFMFAQSYIRRSNITKSDFDVYLWAFAIGLIGPSFYLFSHYGLISSFPLSHQIIYISSLIEFLLFSYFILKKITSVNQNNILLAKSIDLEKEKSFKNILIGEENERERISKELHDGLGLMLSTINTRVSDLANSSVIPKQNNILGKISAELELACQEVRNTSHRLASHMLTRSGLVGAIENDLDRYKERFPRVTISLNSRLEDVDLPIFDKTVIYRTFQDIVAEILNSGQLRSLRIGVLEEENKLIFNYILNGKIELNETNENFENIKARIEILRGEFDLFQREDGFTMMIVAFPIISNQVVFEGESN